MHPHLKEECILHPVAEEGVVEHRVCSTRLTLDWGHFPNDGALEEKMEIHLKYNRMFSLYEGLETRL